MANPLNAKQFPVKDFRQLGEIVQSAANLEADGDNSRWRRCDGRNMPRAKFSSEFLRRYNVPGVMTFTARTLSQTPVTAAVSANGTYFVTSSISSATTQLITSPDGVTYTDRAGTGTAVSNKAIIWTGTNFVIASSGTTKAYYAPDPTATFTIGGTGAVAVSSDINCLAYSASLGRVLHVPNGSGNTVYTSDDNGQTWTARTLAATQTNSQTCWSGSQFIITCSTGKTVQTSADGITWSTVTMPWIYFKTVTKYHIASNGAGVVVMICGDNSSNGAGPALQGYFIISQDGGNTWGLIPTPTFYDAISSTPVVDSVLCTNGVFFSGISASYGTNMLSKDGAVWVFSGAPASSGTCYCVGYKAGVYLRIQESTTAETFSEDLGKLMLPRTTRMYGTGTTVYTPNMGWQDFIKVA